MEENTYKEMTNEEYREEIIKVIYRIDNNQKLMFGLELLYELEKAD